MEIQKQYKAFSQTFTDAQEEQRKELINLIFPSLIEFQQSMVSKLKTNLRQNFCFKEHKDILINYAWKNHHFASALVYQQFIKQQYSDLKQPDISVYYQNQIFPNLLLLGQYRNNLNQYPNRHVSPLQENAFKQLNLIFRQYGYIPSLERYLTFFPNFLVKLRLVQKQLFENSKIDQQTTYFLSLCAAAEMGCPYMINRMAIKFLSKGGKIQWIQKKKYSNKIGAVLLLNRKLARCIWQVQSEDFQEIIEEGHWNINQLTFIIQILSFVHSLCIMTLGLGLIPQQNNSLISTKNIQLCLNEYRRSNSQNEQKQKNSKKPPLKEVITALKIIIQEMKVTSTVVQPKINPKRSFRKQRKNSEQEQSTSIEPYMKEIGNQLTEQRLVIKVLNQMKSFLPEYTLIQKRKDNKNNQFTCVDFNFQFMAFPRLQSFNFVCQSTKKILALIKQSQQMGYQNFGHQMVGSTKQFRRAQRYYAQNLCGFKHPQYDYEKLMNNILPMPLKFYIRLLALSPLHMKRQVLDEVNHEKGEVQLFDLGHTAVLIAITKFKLALTFTTYYFDY